MAKQTNEQKASQPGQYTPVVTPEGKINYVANENLDDWLGVGATLLESSGGLGLGGDDSGSAYGNPNYNPLTGGTDVVGGNSGISGDEYANYKQNVILGGGGTHYTTGGLTSGDITLGNTAGYKPTQGADGVTVWVPTEGYGNTEWNGPAPIGNPNYGNLPPAGGGNQPPPGGGNQPPAGGGDEPPPGGIDWEEVGGPPQPEGGDWEIGRKSPPRDTSWLWDSFKPKNTGDGGWGGYDEDYQAFERYQPGMDSPWGMDNIEGGNRDFYQQQFVNQLRDEQGYQNRERAAQGRRMFAQNNPQETDAQMGDWSWANNGKGLGQVDVSTGTPEDNRQWGLNTGFNSDMTNEEVVRRAFEFDTFSKDQQKNMQYWLNPKNHQDNSWFESTSWANAGNPNEFKSRLGDGLSRENQRWQSQLADILYAKQGALGASAPIGYANPLATYQAAPET